MADFMDNQHLFQRALGAALNQTTTQTISTGVAQWFTIPSEDLKEMTEFRIKILKSPKLKKVMTSQLKAFLKPGLLRENMESLFKRARNTFEGISGLFANQKKIIK